MPVFIVPIRAVLDWNILEWHHFWLPFIIVGILITIVIVNLEMRSYSKKSNLFQAIFIAFWFSYGVTITINGIYDTVSLQHCKKIVLGKDVSSGGKSTMYYVYLDTNSVKLGDKTSVSKKEYDQLNIGDTVIVTIYQGLFHIPYYSIMKD